jgi:MoaA/NifB/PqqE/SkfB family radical SAM enzyme
MHSDNSTIVIGRKAQLKQLRFKLEIVLSTFRRTRNFRKTFEQLQKIKRISQQSTIESTFLKLIQHRDRTFFNFNIPGWPLEGYIDKLVELSEKPSEYNALTQLGMVQIAFTKKCPLNCEHCFEGDVLNQPETLSLKDHKQIIQKLQDNRVPVIHFGGGEPLNRFNDLVEVLKSARPVSDFWIYTSGYGLSVEKAQTLKKAGLTGVSVSIDHYLKKEHNRFRRNEKSYDQAIQAIHNAQKAGLLTVLSVCVTQSFCLEEHLQRYLEFAHTLQVPFVQLIEPRAAGNYAGKDVLLSPSQKQVLDDFYISRNSMKEYAHLPLVQHTGYQQRNKGCAGSGNRYIYIDTDGYVNACPFCESRKSHFLTGNPTEDILALRSEGCEYTKKNEYD